MTRNQENIYKKVNTWSRSPVFPQILSYIVFTSEQLCFYLILFSFLQQLSLHLLMLILYIILSSIQVLSTLICSFIDPADKIMVQYRNTSHNLPGLQNCLYCEYCNSFVNKQSRHCRACDRCVAHFDHHCIWINNCIGKYNYKFFMIMIISTFLVQLLYCVIVCLVQIKSSPDLLSIICMWVIGAFAIVFLFLLANLIVLHLYLMCKGITTFQFISNKKIKEEKLSSQNKSIKQLKPRLHEKTTVQMLNTKVGEEIENPIEQTTAIEDKYQNKKQKTNNKKIKTQQSIDIIFQKQTLQKNDEENQQYSKKQRYKNKHIIGGSIDIKVKRAQQNIPR